MTWSKRVRRLALAVVLVAAAGCYPPSNGNGDGDAWSSGELSVEAGDVVDGGAAFEPYAAGGNAEIELVAGIQGGFHIEPDLRLRGVDSDEFTTVIDYVVTRTSNGDRLNRPSEFTIRSEFGWSEAPSGPGYIHRSNQVILDISRPSQVVGDEVEVQITVDLESGGMGETRVVGTIVDEEQGM